MRSKRKAEKDGCPKGKGGKGQKGVGVVAGPGGI